MGFWKKVVGKIGEDLAANRLKKEGYKIICRNYKSPIGEIDIIAKDCDVLAFIEVRTISSRGFGLPQLSINQRKQRHIIKTALYYLQEKGIKTPNMRFDVVALYPKAECFPSIIGKQGEDMLPTEWEIELIKNAFWVDDSKYFF